jgi:peptidoglycan/LPS O-acetylase OafA/YrhL
MNKYTKIVYIIYAIILLGCAVTINNSYKFAAIFIVISLIAFALIAYFEEHTQKSL